MSNLLPLLIRVMCAVALAALLVGPAYTQSSAPITGIVVDSRGPVAGATVRVQTTSNAATTDASGRFVLSVDGTDPYTLTAWAEGYFCAGPVEAFAGDHDVEFRLIAHSTTDNPSYKWLPSLNAPGAGEHQGCAACHSAVGTALPYTLPVDEWVLDAHSQSAINPRFLTMYAGTDVDGNQSPLTRYVSAKDYGTRPLSPDPNAPYYGPGYKLDFPGTAGNCAACHTPMAAANAPYGVDPRQVAGVDAEGIGCDFCHKVWSVSLDTRTGLPFANMPGVLSYAFRRPDEGHQFFAGPFDDVAPGEDTYSAVQTESAFCAPCHYGVFWDTVVYDSFGEWLASPYSDPITGQTCQDCHMPRLGVPTFALPDQGGLVRDSQTIYSHRMPGALDTALLEATLELAAVARRDGEQLYVHVDVANAGAGHHVPTDSPLRQVLLTVSVADPDMMPVDLLSGPVLPSWSGDLAGHPGLYFAKILQERWTELYPSGAYWMPTRIREDTRLPALGSTTADFVFGTTGDGPVHVEVRAVLRRAFYDLMQQKGWTQPDIEMERVTLRVP